jgi:hypothetical protein
MTHWKPLLITIGIAPVLGLLLVVPTIGILHASGSALGGILFFAILIALQWPIFRLFRKFLPERVDE